MNPVTQSAILSSAIVVPDADCLRTELSQSKKRDMSPKGMSLSLLKSVISMICSPKTYLFLKKSGIWMSFF